MCIKNTFQMGKNVNDFIQDNFTLEKSTKPELSFVEDLVEGLKGG